MTTISVLGDASTGFTVRVRGGDWFSYVIDELKNRIPPGFRSYNPRMKTWRVTSRYYLDKLIGELEGWDDVDVEWETRHDQRRQNQAPPPPKPPSPRESALATLHLLPSAPPELVKAAHKALAMIHHPDRGGDLERMKAINNAFDVLQKAA